MLFNKVIGENENVSFILQKNVTDFLANPTERFPVDQIRILKSVSRSLLHFQSSYFFLASVSSLPSDEIAC